MRKKINRKLYVIVAMILAVTFVFGDTYTLGNIVKAADTVNTVIYYKRSETTSWNDKDVYAKYTLDGGGKWISNPGEKMEKVSAGYWKITVSSSADAEIKVCFTIGNDDWDNNSKNNYKITTGKTNIVDQKKSIVTVDETAVIPTVAPTNTAAGTEDTKTIVLYKRSTTTSWTKAYIYYTTNNGASWITGYGVEMTKISDGYWWYTISSSADAKIKVCFNNGSGTWDSNTNEQNYSVETGKASLVDSSTKTVSITTDIPVTPTPQVTATVIPTATPTVTTAPAVTTTPAATATVTPTVSPTVAPTVVPTLEPTMVPTEEPTLSPAPTEVVNDEKSEENDSIGKISFSAKNKTVGEQVTIKYALTQKESGKKYTYTYLANGKTVASDTKKTAVAWTLSKKGSNTVMVVVYADGEQIGVSQTTYKVGARVIKVSSFKANKKSGQKCNTKIKLSVKASTTKGTLSYKYTVKINGGKETTLKKYSKKKSVIWKPKKAGTYTITVYVKNGKGVVIKSTIKKFKIKKA